MLLLLLAWAAHATTPPEVARARGYLEQGWPEDALTELQAVMQTPEGAESYEVHWLAARAAWQLSDAGAAAELARRAAHLTDDPALRQQAERLASSVERHYGMVTVEGPRAELVTRLVVAWAAGTPAPQIRRELDRVSTDLQDPVTLPVHLSLPRGDYTVNETPLTVSADAWVTVRLPAEAVGRATALQLTRMEMAAGFGTFVGAWADNLGPGPRLNLAVDRPIGALRLGATVQLGDVGYLAGDPRLDGRAGWATPGLRVTRAWSLGPLAVRPGVVLRTGRVPGLAVDCVRGADGAYTCAGPSVDPQELRILTSARALWAGGEVLAETGGRRVRTGLGLEVTGGLGRLPASGVATQTQSGQAHLQWRVIDRGFSLVSGAVLAEVSLTL